jgi:glucose-1-phosphate thymidylyltransferase
MRAIILGAGYGTRLRKSAEGTDHYQYIKETPKPLLDIAGKPLLNHIVDKISLLEVSEVRIIANNYYQSRFEEWEQKYASSYDVPIKIIYNGSNEYGKNLGAVRDLIIALGYDKTYNVEPFEDECMVFFGDKWPSANLEQMQTLMQEKNSTIIGIQDLSSLEKMAQKSQIELDHNNKVIYFEEKAPNPKFTLTCPGFYFIKQEDCKLIQNFFGQNKLPDAPGNLIQYLFEEGASIHGHKIDEEPYDFGDLEAYLRVKNILEK